MARKLFHLGLLGVVLVAGATSYAVRRNLLSADDSPMNCARQWLDLSRKQCRNIRSKDPDFREEAQALSLTLQQARLAMATLVADVESSDEALFNQTQLVLEAHHALMRRSLRHLLVMREFADVSQAVRLNALCSNAMRCGQGRGPGMGMGPGRGMGPGMGPGGGMGMMGMRHRQRRGQGALAPALSLTEAQQETINQIAPNFEAECLDFMRQVRFAHVALSTLLQDAESSEESIQQALESFIAARTAFEKHTIDYVISIRSLLTEDQQQRLIGLCKRGC
jgi:Spy/CpxP family protein refolding chaperone